MDSCTRTAELVFIPAPASGHIFSAVEIAKLLVDRDSRLSITILIMNLPFDSNATAYAASLAATFVPSKDQRISFIALPQLDLENFTFSTISTSSSITAKLRAMYAAHNPLVWDAVTKLRSDGVLLSGFIIDMACTSMIDIANEFGLPTYLYFTSGAATLSLLLHLRALQDKHSRQPLTDFIDMDAELLIPGFSNPVQIGRNFPLLLADEDTPTLFLEVIAKYKETKGILVNTFAEFEPHAVKALWEAVHNNVPTVYPVGPILNLTGGNQGSNDHNDQEGQIMAWLDDQPPSSVVFLCFGSMGSFGEEEVKEIAIGLERCGHRFIWSLRNPSKDKLQPGEYENPQEVLPEGFVERTSEFGMVIGWAPQVAVLSHAAIGGFVSHCGWNSILESLWFGVPIATWPMYAEQQLNAFTMVKELGLATEITLDYKKDIWNGTTNFIVSAEDVERGVRSVMEQHTEVRGKVKVMKEASRKALIETGSSYSWLGRFIEDVIINMS